MFNLAIFLFLMWLFTGARADINWVYDGKKHTFQLNPKQKKNKKCN